MRNPLESLDALNQDFKYLYGAIHFKNGDFNILDRFNNDAFVNEIIVAVKEMPNVSCIESFHPNDFPLLSIHVDHIYLKNTDPETGILWWPAHLQSGEIKDPTDRLVEIVKEKNESASTYDRNTPQHKWLLIYSASEGLTDMVGVYSDPKISTELGKLNFDKVYVWNKFLEEIDEIYPKFVKIFSAKAQGLHSKRYPLNVRPFIILT